MCKMYRIIALASSIFCFVSGISAQDFSSNRIQNRFELVAGPSISKNTGYLSDYDSKAGYSIGIGYYQKFSTSFSVPVRKEIIRLG